jgi:FAD/FMN-containing dehydrogenase
MTYLSHDAKVQQLIQQIVQARQDKSGIKLHKGAVSHFVPNPYEGKSNKRHIRTQGLNELLSVDTGQRLAVVEPGITFANLVQATLKHSLIPYTVPELKGITVGGAVSGCSLESMSYRYGGFHDRCLEYEVVSGRGEVILCSRQNNRDLFEMIHGSYGTLGFISKITMELLPAKPYVHMHYHTFRTLADFWAFLKERCEKSDYDFVDAIVHAPDCLVVCLGQMVETAPYTTAYDWLRVFYKSTSTRQEEYLTTYDYFFRYDTECHWLSRTVPMLESWPMRLLVGKFVLGSSNMIRWSKRLSPLLRMKKRPDVVVDVFIPARRLEEFFGWYTETFRYWPLWIVPYRAPQHYAWISDEQQQRMGELFLIDCAIYGKPNGEEGNDYSELLERKVMELGGIKTLISRNHYDAETFWQIYSKPRYLAAKERLDPDHLFPDLYEKFQPSHYQPTGNAHVGIKIS